MGTIDTSKIGLDYGVCKFKIIDGCEGKKIVKIQTNDKDKGNYSIITDEIGISELINKGFLII